MVIVITIICGWGWGTSGRGGHFIAIAIDYFKVVFSIIMSNYMITITIFNY